MNNVSLERCYKPPDFLYKKIELHHFGDAAPDLGIGQSSYLRFIDDNDRVHCTFIFGKSRVPPLKCMTVPRMELNAAVLCVRNASTNTTE